MHLQILQMDELSSYCDPVVVQTKGRRRRKQKYKHKCVFLPVRMKYNAINHVIEVEKKRSSRDPLNLVAAFLQKLT